MWNLSNGDEIDRIDAGDTLEIVRFSSDGVQVIIGCKDDLVFFWDWQIRDAPLKRVILPSLWTVEIACDSNMIYTCSRDMHVCKIDVGSQRISTVHEGLPAPIISPDGKGVFAGTLQKNEFRCWEYLKEKGKNGVVKYDAGGYT